MNLSAEAKNAKEMVERRYNVKLHTRCRTSPYIKARCMFSMLLFKKGYGCYAISKMLELNHAFIKQTKILLKVMNSFMNK
jgi:hypothetical protein